MEKNILKIPHPVGRKCSSVKVHYVICLELSKILDKIMYILPALESARPGSTCGIRALSALNALLEKGKLIIQYCTESSKLFLALTGKTILGRCERVKSSLIQNLSQIESLVPIVLASQVGEIIFFLENIKFNMDPREEKAGDVILKLLSQTNSNEEMESNTMQIATSNLNLTSPKSILIEKRSIRKLHEQIKDTDPKKENVLEFLFYLVQKYGKNIQHDPDKIDENFEINYEEGKLPDLNFNSVSSLKSVCVSLLEGRVENYDSSETELSDFSNISIIEDESETSSQILFPCSVDYTKNGFFSEFDPDKFVNFFKDLSKLKRENREKAVEDLKMVLEKEIETCYLMLSNGFGEGLVEFLINSRDSCDENAQKIGTQLFLAFLRNNRVEFPTLSEEIFKILKPFLDPETREALSILQKFSQFFDNNSTPYSHNSPSNHVSSEDINIMEICMEIILDLSFQNNTTKSQVFSSGYLKALVSIISMEKLTEFSLKILQITSCLEEGAKLVIQNPKFISCLVELLETGTIDEKEISLNILFHLCNKDHENCVIVGKECVIPALVLLSVNGNEHEMEMSSKLLQLLEDLRDDECEVDDCTSNGAGTEIFTGHQDEIVSKEVGLLGKKKGVFSRFKQLALF